MNKKGAGNAVCYRDQKHDIRSPLSVLKGYQEMLIDYFPDGTIDREKTVEMLQEGMKQIRRMDVFIDFQEK